MKCLLGFFLLIVLILVCGCTGVSPDTTAPVQTPAVSAAGTAPASSATGTALAELSSAQPNASLALEAGALILSFQADGPQFMSFTITEGNGTMYSEMEELVMTGPYAGSVIFGPPDTAEYVVNITSNGTWTARLIRPDVTHALSAPVNLSGDGATVSPLLALEKGEYIFSRDETGLASPLYEFRFANGSVVMNADNACVLPCIGMDSPHPFVIIAIPETGTYVLNVISRDSPHPWNASISEAPAILPMGPGPVMPTGT
jgi:hypothetical protein